MTVLRRKKRPRLLRGMTVGVVGLGQIGGSVVKALAPHRPALQIIGHDRIAAIRGKSRRYLRWAETLGEAVQDSDCLILAIPVPQIIEVLPQIARLAASRAPHRRLLVLDTGTIKTPVVRAASRHRRSFDFIGLHPLSGGERNGWPASRAGLFNNDRVICCAARRTRSELMAHELIRLLGAHVIHIAPKQHDRMIATTIGLPHMLAFAAQGLPSRSGAVQRLHGRSWGTLTRVAASDPAMVGGFLCTNAQEQTRVARQFQRHLEQIIEALKDPSGRMIERLLRRWQTN